MTVAVAGDYAYLASENAGLLTINIKNQADLRVVAQYELYDQMSSVTLSGDHLYVADQVMAVFDRADPAAPALVWTGPIGKSDRLALLGQQVCLADGVGGLQVIDCGDFAHPKRVGRWPETENGRSAVIDAVVSGSLVWVIDQAEGLLALDLSDPDHPKKVGGYAMRGANYLALSRGYAYVLTSGLLVFDISNPAKPRLLSAHNQSNFGFSSHLALSGPRLYTGAQTGFDVYDIANPIQPEPVGQYRATDRNSSELQTVAVAGNYAYVLYHDAGLDIVDVSNVANPQRVSTYRQQTVHFGLTLSGNLAFITGGHLEIVDVANPALPQLIAGVKCYGRGVAVQENRVYLIDPMYGLTTVTLPDWFPRFEPHPTLDDQGCHLYFRAQAGQVVQLQRSQDLQTWQDWQTLTATGARQEVVDGTAPKAGRQFYRAMGVLP